MSYSQLEPNRTILYFAMNLARQGCARSFTVAAEIIRSARCDLSIGTVSFI